MHNGIREVKGLDHKAEPAEMDYKMYPINRNDWLTYRREFVSSLFYCSIFIDSKNIFTANLLYEINLQSTSLPNQMCFETVWNVVDMYLNDLKTISSSIWGISIISYE